MVDGKCSTGQCVYRENVKFPAGGIALVGSGYPVIDGGHAGRTVTFFPRATERSSISGFEIINGMTDEDGAGVYALDSPVSIVDCCIHDNEAEATEHASGGGIAIVYSESMLDRLARKKSVIEHNGIYRNKAYCGGGIAAKGSLSNNQFESSLVQAALEIVGNVIGPDNVAKGDDHIYGGGISVYSLPVSIEGNDIHHNSSGQYGGGIGVFNVNRNNWAEEGLNAISLWISGSPGKLKAKQIALSRNRVHHNEAWKGGGIAGMWFAVIQYSEDIIEENTLSKHSDAHGGGIYASTAAVHQLTKTLIRANKATHPSDGRGGGIHASCNAVINFEGDNIVSENEAESYGGGISLDNADMFSEGGVFRIADNKVTDQHVDKTKLPGDVGSVSGMGGGIYMCSSDSTEGGKVMRWQPCNHNNTLVLKEALVEGNNVPGHGSGIAVEKVFAGVAAVQGNVTIDRCVIRKNTSNAADGDGVYFGGGGGASATDAFAVTGSLVEGHMGGTVAGVRILDRHGSSSVESSVFRENDIGVYDEGTLSAKSNLFERNNRTQLELVAGIKKSNPDYNESDAHAPVSGGSDTPKEIDLTRGTKVTGNVFDGRRHALLGILINDIKMEHQRKIKAKVPEYEIRYSLFGGELSNNDISGHVQFGVTGNTLDALAKNNWWGAADGPASPGGKGSGDRVSKEVHFKPFSPNRINIPPRGPRLTPPSPPTFTPPRGPDCTALSERKRKPRQPGITEQPPPGILKVPDPGTVPEPAPETATQPEPTQPGRPVPSSPPQTPPSSGGAPVKKWGGRPKRGKWLYVASAMALVAIVATSAAFLAFPPGPVGRLTTSSSRTSAVVLTTTSGLAVSESTSGGVSVRTASTFTTTSSPSTSTASTTSILTTSSTSTSAFVMEGFVDCSSDSLVFLPPSGPQTNCFNFTGSGYLTVQGTWSGATMNFHSGEQVTFTTYFFGSGTMQAQFYFYDQATNQLIASANSAPVTIGGGSCAGAVAVTGSTAATAGNTVSSGDLLQFYATFMFSSPTGVANFCSGGSTQDGFQVGP